MSSFRYTRVTLEGTMHHVSKLTQQTQQSNKPCSPSCSNVGQSENQNAYHCSIHGVNLIRNEKFVGDKKSTTFIIKLPATSFWWWARGVRWTWGLRWWWTCFAYQDLGPSPCLCRHPGASYFLIHLCIFCQNVKIALRGECWWEGYWIFCERKEMTSFRFP